MELQWTSNQDLAAVHVAWSLARDAGLAAKLSVELGKAAEGLEAIRQSCSTVPAELFWEEAFTLSTTTPVNREFAERLLKRCRPGAALTPALVSELTACIGALESSFQRASPDFDKQMSLRVGPLRQQWETMGPGLLRSVGRFSTPDLLVESATIYLVPPLAGGSGFAHIRSNRVHIEAVLTDVDPRLPEVLRLCWLLSQLDFERPVYSDRINMFRLNCIAGLAMIPPTLLAGEHLEITQFTPELLQRAIELWHLPRHGLTAEALAQVVFAWWDTFVGTESPWPLALAGLDRMLGGE